MNIIKSPFIIIITLSSSSALDCPKIPDNLSYVPRISQIRYEHALKTTPLLTSGAKYGIRVKHPDMTLFGVNFYRTNFIDTPLNQLGLDFSNLSEAHLIDGKIQFGRFIGANISKADFTGADLRGSDFYGAIAMGTIFQNCELAYARFENLDLTNALFLGALGLEHVVFQNCILKGTIFTSGQRIITQNCILDDKSINDNPSVSTIRFRVSARKSQVL